VANRVVSVALRAEIGQYMAGMAQAAGATKGLGETADVTGKKAKSGFDIASKGALLMGGAVVAGLGLAVSKSMDFEKSMSAVQAATQASASTLGDLREAAMRAGADTQYSATEAADAITEMAKAGVSAKDIMGGGLAGALDLAAAGQLEVADAAGIAAVAMTQFNLSGEDLPHVADLLAAGAGKTMGSVDDLGQALNQAGLIASAAGLSIEETTGGLAAFASAGLIGSDAGTSFKTMLQALQAPTGKSAELMESLGINMYDANGNMLGLSEMAGQLQDALGHLTEEQRNAALAQIFGSDAVRAANVLYKEGAAGITEWTAKVNDSGYAQEQAAALTDNLAGDLERLGGSFETLMIGMGSGAQGPLREVVQALTGMLDVASGVLEFWSDLPGPVQAGVAALGALALLNGPLSGVLGTLRGFGGSAIAPAAGTVSAFGQALGYARANGDGLGTVLRSVGDYAGGQFKGAMSGLMAMLGGPWGMAMAAATVVVTMFGSAISDASAQEDKWAQSFLEGGNSIKNTMAEIAAERAKYGDNWVGDLSYNIDQFFGLASSMEDAKAKAREMYDAMTPLQQAQQNVTFDTNRLAEAIDRFGEGSPQAAQAADLLAASQERLASRQGAVTAATDQATASLLAAQDPAAAMQERLEGISDAASNSSKQIDLYKTSLDVLNGAHITAIQAESDFYAALADTSTALEGATGRVIDETGALDLHTVAGRKTADALVGVKDKADQWIATMIEQGATSEQANAKDAELRQSFYDTALQMTGSRDAAQKLTDSIYGIPESRTTQINANTAGASSAISGLQAQIDAIARDRTASINFRATLPDLNGAASGSGRPGLATGGHVRGPGSGTSDSIPVNLSNGEYVIKASRVREIGVGTLNDVNAGRRGFADGGLVSLEALANTSDAVAGLGRFGDQLSSAVSKAASSLAATSAAAGPAGAGGGMSGTWTSIWGIVKAAIPQARQNSTYRPGDPGYHGKNKAVDFGFGSGPGGAGSAGLASIARFLYTGYGRSLAEIIYDGIGDNTPDVKNGRDHVYNAATRAQHHNHVHAAVYDQGGPLYPGWTMAYNGTGQTEHVIKSREFSGASARPAESIDYVRLGAAIAANSGSPVTIQTADNPRAIVRALDAREHQQAALASPWGG